MNVAIPGPIHLIFNILCKHSIYKAYKVSCFFFFVFVFFFWGGGGGGGYEKATETGNIVC